MSLFDDDDLADSADWDHTRQFLINVSTHEEHQVNIRLSIR